MQRSSVRCAPISVSIRILRTGSKAHAVCVLDVLEPGQDGAALAQFVHHVRFILEVTQKDDKVIRELSRRSTVSAFQVRTMMDYRYPIECIGQLFLGRVLATGCGPRPPVLDPFYVAVEILDVVGDFLVNINLDCNVFCLPNRVCHTEAPVAPVTRFIACTSSSAPWATMPRPWVPATVWPKFAAQMAMG